MPHNEGLYLNKANLTLRGEGRNSIVMLGPEAKLAIAFIAAPNVLIEKLVFDGNAANRVRRDPSTGLMLSYPCGLIVGALIEGDERTVGKGTVQDVEIRNSLEDGVGMFLSPNFLVQSSYIHDIGGGHLESARG